MLIFVVFVTLPWTALILKAVKLASEVDWLIILKMIVIAVPFGNAEY